MSNTHPIEILARRYPQLSLPIQKGERETQQYKSAVLSGEDTGLRPDFTFNVNDRLESVSTPAGAAEILCLTAREDFIHALRALAYRCEPVDIPDSNGASAISGLINWEKLRPHLDVDFEQFTADKSNYLDSLIILSSGNYSALSAEYAGYDEDTWGEKSITIRKYHELTHFVSARLYKENKEVLRDEVIADMLGLTAAFGYYDTVLAKKFLGTAGETYRGGGRLQNYCDDPRAKMPVVNGIIDLLEPVANSRRPQNEKELFELLEYIEENGIGLY